MKTCSKCNQSKDLSEFYTDKSKTSGIVSRCKSCCKEDRIINKPKKSEYLKQYYSFNKNKINNKHKKHYNKNKEYILLKHKEWKSNNKEQINLYHKTKKQNDSSYRIASLLRCRLNHAIKKEYKSDHTLNLLGCSLDYLKKYLQQTATNNGYKDFDINNYSGREYHIDHIVPCDAFNLNCNYHQKLCFNYTNLQILDAVKNLLKSNEIKE